MSHFYIFQQARFGFAMALLDSRDSALLVSRELHAWTLPRHLSAHQTYETHYDPGATIHNFCRANLSSISGLIILYTLCG